MFGFFLSARSDEKEVSRSIKSRSAADTRRRGRQAITNAKFKSFQHRRLSSSAQQLDMSIFPVLRFSYERKTIAVDSIVHFLQLHSAFSIFLEHHFHIDASIGYQRSLDVYLTFFSTDTEITDKPLPENVFISNCYMCFFCLFFLFAASFISFGIFKLCLKSKCRR